MSLPTFPDKDNIPTREEVVNLIISSIAMEELGLSHIINAEGEKLQYALGTIPGLSAPDEPLTMEELLKLNDSVHKTLDSTMMNQFFLKEKLVSALSASVMQGPEGPRGPQGPATITVDPVVENLEPGEPPYVNNDQGTEVDVILKFGIPRGETGATGPVGTILDTFETLDELRQAHPEGGQGDAYLVGGELYVWNTETEEWESVGNLQGPQGIGTTIKGSADSKDELDQLYPDGPPEDAYIVNGDIYIWNPTDKWHSAGSLRGPAGPAGATGPKGDQGIQGVTGAQGVQGIPGTSGIIKGVYATEGDLRTAHPTGADGDFYLIGNDMDGYSLWVWNSVAGPDGDWLNTGAFMGAQGPMGPEGPMGPQGPSGSLEPDSELFNVKSQSDSGTVLLDGELEFKSDTLNISVETGPAVRIEKPSGIGTVIPFSSGIQLRVNTATGGGRNGVAMVGFGNGATIDSPGDPIVLPAALAGENTVQTEFSIPADGTITAISAYFTGMSGGLALVDHYVTAELFQSTDPDSGEFFPLEGAKLEFDVITGSVLPSVRRHAIATDLNIPVAAHTRLLIVYHTRTPDYGASTYLLGYMSGSIEIK